MTPENASPAELLASLPEQERTAWLQALTGPELLRLEYEWRFWARPKQVAPPGDWDVWMLRAGRGFGKTRTGAGWAHERATEERREIALVAQTPADARDFMVEGPGGLLRNTPPEERPEYLPSKRRLEWPNGSVGTIFSSAKPDQLRGFSGDTAWIDELAKYDNPREVWEMLDFGMREVSADRPRRLITTTPRPLPLLEEIEDDPGTVVVRGSSYENRTNLSPAWFQRTLGKYEGTELGRQEIYAEILDAVEGRVYSSFSRARWPAGNLDPDVHDVGGPLYVGQDFNVNPMASVLAQRVAGECWVLEAWELAHTNTEAVARELRARWGDREIIVCPDPSGRARKTSAPAGQTDFTILERAGFQVRAPYAAPPVVDRVNNTIANLAQGESRRVRIHPDRAKPLVRALGGLTYKQGTNQRDKASGYDHVCDALDYLLWEEWNVLGQRQAVEVGQLHI